MNTDFIGQLLSELLVKVNKLKEKGKNTTKSEEIEEIAKEMRQLQIDLAKELDQHIPKGLNRTVQEIFEFRFMLSQESDRGCVLAAASLIETDLGSLITAHLVDEPKIYKPLLDGEGPLATFSSRINIAYLLGLVTKDTFRDCNLIKRIRNKCAHEYKEINFNRPDIAAACKELSGRRIGSGDEIDKSSDPRHRFMSTAITVLAEIHGTWAEAKRPSVKEISHENKFLEALIAIESEN